MDIFSYQLKNYNTPSQILDNFREECKLKNQGILVKARDIYNAKRIIKQRALGGLTPTQALLKMLISGKTKNTKKQVFKARKNTQGQLTYLFFANRRAFKLLRKNHEVLIADCIYKTNKFKLPLYTVQGITVIKSTFIASYSFILSEKDRDYIQVIIQPRLLYN